MIWLLLMWYIIGFVGFVVVRRLIWGAIIWLEGRRRGRANRELQAREAFGREFDKRRAAVEVDPTLTRFEREMVADSARILPEIRDYMVRRQTWTVPFWASKRTSQSVDSVKVSGPNKTTHDISS